MSPGIAVHPTRFRIHHELTINSHKNSLIFHIEASLLLSIFGAYGLNFKRIVHVCLLMVIHCLSSFQQELTSNYLKSQFSAENNLESLIVHTASSYVILNAVRSFYHKGAASAHCVNGEHIINYFLGFFFLLRDVAFCPMGAEICTCHAFESIGVHIFGRKCRKYGYIVSNWHINKGQPMSNTTFGNLDAKSMTQLRENKLSTHVTAILIHPLESFQIFLITTTCKKVLGVARQVEYLLSFDDNSTNWVDRTERWCEMLICWYIWWYRARKRSLAQWMVSIVTKMFIHLVCRHHRNTFLSWCIWYMSSMPVCVSTIHFRHLWDERE